MAVKKKGRKSNRKLKKEVIEDDDTKNKSDTNSEETRPVKKLKKTEEELPNKKKESIDMDQSSCKSYLDSENKFKSARKEQRMLMYKRIKDSINKAVNDEIKELRKYARFEVLPPKMDFSDDSEDLDIEHDLELLGIN